MEKLFLVCNAHLDPIWLWEWPEGAAAAISTFQVAADFCEEYDGFIFCHNEALLYQWVEEYAPMLFARIGRLVAAGKWRIIGGWYLQPDCNMPSGESMLRQIISGLHYFMEKFQTRPTCAVNFDSFGHDRGMVQIMKECGYDSYLFMRPEKFRMELPARNFIWKGYDGSEILVRRLDRAYNTLKGEAAASAERWVNKVSEEDISLFTWGIGNHGGGPSRKDWKDLKAWMAQKTDMECIPGSLEDFFSALREKHNDFPVVATDLRPVFVGCYVSMAKIKRLHCQLENKLYETEKLLANAAAQGLCEYPANDLAAVQKTLHLSEFHDILPGTSIASAEKNMLHSLGGGLDTLSKLYTRGFMRMLTGQRKAREGEYPIFFYNPHPYPVTADLSCELLLANQNWNPDVWHRFVVRRGDEVLFSQTEKEASTINLDWCKKVVFRGTLKPCGITRFDCVLEELPYTAPAVAQIAVAPIVIETENALVQISHKTGLVDRYCVNGVDYLQKEALSTVVFDDNADPWNMESNHFGSECGRFRLMTPEEAGQFLNSCDGIAPPVRIVEDGDVRTVVEALFVYNRSYLVQTYYISKCDSKLQIQQRIQWNEYDKIAKLEVPTTLYNAAYKGQGMFGTASLPQDGTEAVSQRWLGLFGDGHALTVINNGTYGSHLNENKMYISLLRSPGYSVHPIPDRDLIPDTKRYLARMDQGVHLLEFELNGNTVADRISNVEFESQIFQQQPYGLNAFPTGDGVLPSDFIELSDKEVILSAAVYDAENERTILRLWNSAEKEKSVNVKLHLYGTEIRISMRPCGLYTYQINKDGSLCEIDPVTKTV